MPKKHHPRRSSLGFRPRKRANSQNARIRNWPNVSDSIPLGFAGYKAGMTHVIVKDNRKTTPTKDKDVRFSVTIIECPPLKVIGIRGFKKKIYGLDCFAQIWVDNLAKVDKFLSKTLFLPKKTQKTSDLRNMDEIRILVLTQPGKTSIGKKKPEIFELALGGKVDDQLKFAESLLGKEIKISDVFKEGQQVDISSITKGKGLQGPVKRHGVKIRFHKSEKTKRGPGSLGPWHGPRIWRVAHAGQTGYHQRSEHNKHVIKISEDPKLINPKGGLLQYGLVKNDFILLKGSIGGSRKRLIKLIHAKRPSKKITKEAPIISYISLESKQ